MGLSNCSKVCRDGDDNLLYGCINGGPERLVTEGLAYAPPPRHCCAEEVLGVKVPRPPHEWVPTVPVRAISSSSRECTPMPTPVGRADEPQNKVYVQFSDDFEGFLPYLLLITEEQGLMFTSLSPSPDFVLDPLQFITVARIEYDALVQDSFFVNLSRSILGRKRMLGQKAVQDCNQPPYPALVQVLLWRKGEQVGGQVLIFIAVQNDPLANDLVRGCHQLKKKKRALQNSAGHRGPNASGHSTGRLTPPESRHSSRARTPPSLRTPPRSVTPPGTRRPVRGASPATGRTPRREQTVP